MFFKSFHNTFTFTRIYDWLSIVFLFYIGIEDLIR